MIPCLRCLDWWKERNLKKFVEERKMVLKEEIEEHRKVLKKEDKDGKDINGVKPLIQVLLEFQEDEPEYYTNEVIFGLILVSYSISYTPLSFNSCLSFWFECTPILLSYLLLPAFYGVILIQNIYLAIECFIDLFFFFTYQTNF